MNFIHGFDSLNSEINPDNISMLSGLESTHLCLAEDFLQGSSTFNPVSNPLMAHEIVKVIYQAGKRKYPTLWDSADKYVNGNDYLALEKLSNQ